MPPYAWHWQGGSTDSLLSGLAAGAYPVTVTDARGCVATGTVQVTREGNLDVSIQITEISCFGAADGAFTVLPENGKAPYAWNWENGSTGPDLGPLGPGNYLGTVTDALGCSIALVLPLDEPDSLQFTATVHNASGPQASDGSIIVAPVSGGTMPYYFQWDNGDMNDTLGALLPGLYTLTLSDERGCSATGSFEVSWSSGTSEAGSRAHLLLFPTPPARRRRSRANFGTGVFRRA
ncbi:MAG: SprB repeat-containing protein [Lewinellaceae bacterium]|nr:SprB repeat-containing protein [Lewinellaceae bacterium]